MISDSRDREKTEKIESMTKKCRQKCWGVKQKFFLKIEKRSFFKNFGREMFPPKLHARSPTMSYTTLKYLTINTSFIHSFIHSFILNIYIAPLQENYLEALPTPARSNKAV